MTRNLIFILALFLPAAAGAADAAEIQLDSNGNTKYQIVCASDASGLDRYAAETLAGYLRESTGAEFPIVAADERDGDRPAIFIGKPAGPLDELEEQEHVARSVGRDIFLYGNGHRASLDAVMEFLENSLGWRWFSPFEKPVVPKHQTLTLEPFHRKRGFDFRSRQLAMRYNADFYLQNGVNMGLETKLLRRGEPVPDHLRSWMPNENFVHTTFSYIPPMPTDKYANEFSWQEKRNYFETNPEFFSLGETGERVPNLQLCFSNRGLRDELTRNVRRQLAASGERQIIMIDAADRPGKFCHCEGCVALEEQHQTPGGPLFDYLIELSRQLLETHPEAMVKTLAYRRSQTQIPPRLPQGEKLPANLIIDFAPIEDAYFADWTHSDPSIQETFQHLRDWAAITAPGNLWAWMYPNPWGSGHALPVGNVERVVTNMRLMHEIGVRGIFLDHNGINSRSGWSELQAFLILRLTQDIDADTDALIEEFTDHVYGPTAPLVRQYLEELETARKAMNTFAPGVTYKSRNFDERTFPYLTPENIHRWQQRFEEMETRLADSPQQLLDVRSLRRELDIATLWKWFDLQGAYPDSYTNHKAVAERIAAANIAKSSAGVQPVWMLGDQAVADFVTLIDAGGEKPLPKQFAGIDRSRIRTFLPVNAKRGKEMRNLKDPDAGFGLATIVDQPGDPFRCGFSEWKSRTPRNIVHGPRLELTDAQIKPGEYQLHRLGEIEVTTDDSLIWFGRSWATSVAIGSRLYFPGEASRWDTWVSLKFTDDDQVFCDRVFLVQQTE